MNSYSSFGFTIKSQSTIDVKRGFRHQRKQNHHVFNPKTIIFRFLFASPFLARQIKFVFKIQEVIKKFQKQNQTVCFAIVEIFPDDENDSDRICLTIYWIHWIKIAFDIYFILFFSALKTGAPEKNAGKQTNIAYEKCAKNPKKFNKPIYGNVSLDFMIVAKNWSKHSCCGCTFWSFWMKRRRFCMAHTALAHDVLS